MNSNILCLVALLIVHPIFAQTDLFDSEGDPLLGSIETTYSATYS